MNMTVFSVLVSLMQGAESASEILATMRDLDADGRAPALASFYRNLKRALDAGWLEVTGETPSGPSAGRPRQTYRMTPKGREAVRAEAARLRHMAGLAMGEDSLVHPESG